MSKKKVKAAEVKPKQTEEVHVDDLYTAFKAAYEALKSGRYKLFLKGKEHFLKGEYGEAKHYFEELKNSLFRHTQDTTRPLAKCVQLTEYIADHIKPLKYKTANSTAQSDHLKYMKNHIDTLDRQIY